MKPLHSDFVDRMWFVSCFFFFDFVRKWISWMCPICSDFTTISFVLFNYYYYYIIELVVSFASEALNIEYDRILMRQCHFKTIGTLLLHHSTFIIKSQCHGRIYDANVCLSPFSICSLILNHFLFFLFLAICLCLFFLLVVVCTK